MPEWEGDIRWYGERRNGKRYGRWFGYEDRAGYIVAWGTEPSKRTITWTLTESDPRPKFFDGTLERTGYLVHDRFYDEDGNLHGPDLLYAGNQYLMQHDTYEHGERTHHSFYSILDGSLVNDYDC